MDLTSPRSTDRWIETKPGSTQAGGNCTRHGHPIAVLVSPDDLASIEETLDVLSSPDVMRQLAESREAIDAGDVLDSETLGELLAQRRRQAS